MRESSAICHGDKGKSPHGVLVSELLAAFFLRSLVAGVKLGSVNAVLNKWLVCDWPFLAPPQTPALDAGTSKRSPITQLETSKPNQTSSRRTLLKAAAWATPVITIAVAAPLAAASINDASLALQQQANNGSFPNDLESSGTTFPIPISFNRPGQLRLINGPGVISGPLTGTVTVAFLSSSNLSALGGDVTLRGFGPTAIQGATMGAITKSTVFVKDDGGGDIFATNVTRAFTLTAAQINGNVDFASTITWGVTVASGSALPTGGSVTYSVTVTLNSPLGSFDPAVGQLTRTF